MIPMNNSNVKWEDIEIDMNDKRLSNYIIYVDFNGRLTIMNKSTFNLIKIAKSNNIENGYILFDSCDNVMSIFTDINFLLEQVWNN